jgi:hypothetical protein
MTPDRQTLVRSGSVQSGCQSAYPVQQIAPPSRTMLIVQLVLKNRFGTHAASAIRNGTRQSTWWAPANLSGVRRSMLYPTNRFLRTDCAARLPNGISSLTVATSDDELVLKNQFDDTKVTVIRSAAMRSPLWFPVSLSGARQRQSYRGNRLLRTDSGFAPADDAASCIGMGSVVSASPIGYKSVLSNRFADGLQIVGRCDGTAHSTRPTPAIRQQLSYRPTAVIPRGKEDE